MHGCHKAILRLRRFSVSHLKIGVYNSFIDLQDGSPEHLQETNVGGHGTRLRTASVLLQAERR